MTQIIGWGLLVLCVCASIWLYRFNKELNRRLKRNNEVYNFRCHIILRYPNLRDQLPDYYQMVKDKTPLTIENYFPNFKPTESHEPSQLP
jgi:hypothetical protein